MNSGELVHATLNRPTNCRTTKIKYEVVAPNIRRTVFHHSNLLKKFVTLSATFAKYRHTKQSVHVSDVITYPLIQEAFAFLESNLECAIEPSNSEASL